MIMLRNGRYTAQLFTDNLMHGKLTMVINEVSGRFGIVSNKFRAVAAIKCFLLKCKENSHYD